MVNVSFIIATCRDNRYVSQTIDSINALPNRFTYEICIYGPNYIQGQNVRYFKEDELRGPHYGFNYLVNRCEGEYIYQLVDDMAIHNTGWEAISFLESPIFVTVATGNATTGGASKSIAVLDGATTRYIALYDAIS